MAHTTPGKEAFQSNYEMGYKALLVREETKDRLRAVRAALPDRDLNQERRLATAALDMVIEDAESNPTVMERWGRRVREIVQRDLYGMDREITSLRRRD